MLLGVSVGGAVLFGVSVGSAVVLGVSVGGASISNVMPDLLVVAVTGLSAERV